MRKLSQRQKTLLNQASRIGYTSVDELPTTTWAEIEQEDYETLWQDADRYLSDKFFEKQNEK